MGGGEGLLAVKNWTRGKPALSQLILGDVMVRFLLVSWNVWLFFRPNGGFMNQLELWGAMRCRIDQNNKSYRAYRLKHMAQEVQGLCNS